MCDVERNTDYFTERLLPEKEADLIEKKPEPKLMTNGDCIRAMSDEELAKIISDGGCPPKISEIVCETTDDCNVCWRNWLKQSAEVKHE